MDDPKKILIIQLKRAGDVVLTTPVAEVLKRRFPKAQIDFLVDKAFASLLEHNPTIDSIVRYDRDHVWQNYGRIRQARYDWIYDFQSSPRSAPLVFYSGAKVTAGYRVPFWGHAYKQAQKRPGSVVGVVRGKLALMEPQIGIVMDVPERRVYSTNEERSAAELLLPKQSSSWIGLIPPHRHISRRWWGESFAALARKLGDAGHSVVLFAGPGEEAYVETVRAAAPSCKQVNVTSFRQWAAVLSRCVLIVSNDSGPMHIAVAVGCRTVAIYGPTDAACLRPEGPQHRGLQADELGCIRCNMNVCPFAHECMTLITPEKAFAACQELLIQPSVSGVSR